MVNEAGLKQAAAREYENAKMAQGTVGSGLAGASVTPDACGPMRESMTGSLRSRLERSRRESRKAERLEELLCLLGKNPEIARILDLVDAVGRDY